MLTGGGKQYGEHHMLSVQFTCILSCISNFKDEHASVCSSLSRDVFRLDIFGWK